MKCVNCGTEYEGKFCPECGTKTQEPAPTPSMTEQQVNFQRQKVNQPLEAGKKGRKKLNKPKKPIYKKWWFYVIIGIALISIIGAVASGKKTEKIKWNEMVLSAQLPESLLQIKEKFTKIRLRRFISRLKISPAANMQIMLPLLRKRALQPMQNRLLIHTRHIILTATV